MAAIAAVAVTLQAISLTALGLALRQIRLARAANHLPVVLDAFQHTRSAAWCEAEDYVLTKLAGEYPADGGYRGLPEQARAHANTIGLFYDDLGKLIAHGMIDQSLVIGAYGTPIMQLWDALAPYAYAERQAHERSFWIYFEDLAARTAETPPTHVYAKLGLRSRPPQPEAAQAVSSDEKMAPDQVER